MTMMRHTAVAGPAHSEAWEGIQVLRRTADDRQAALEVPDSVRQALREPGRPLEQGLRGEFETRFGRDFSQVRVHTGAAASASTREIGARAYTAGRDIVFADGGYAPQSASGRSLLAHELTHVAQQRGMSPGAELRMAADGGAHEAQARQAESTQGHPAAMLPAGGMLQCAPDPKAVAEFDKRVAKLRTDKVYIGLPPVAKSEFNQIVTITRTRDNPLYFVGKLEDLLGTREEAAAKQAKAFAKETQDAADREATRLKDPKEQAAVGNEEAVSKDPKRVFSKAFGLDKKTSFEIDARDPSDVAIKAKVRLNRAGQGTNKDVSNVRSLEDVIEKRASMLGYSLDLSFVDKPGPDVFEVNVDTSQWTVSSNWVGDDVGLVHELHHLLGLKEDRYDYIAAHAKNKKMKIPDRIHWFRVELDKIIDNNFESMMNTGNKLPLDDDVCMVIVNGKRAKPASTKAEIDADKVDIAACVKKREASRELKFKPALNKALSWVQKAGTAPDTKTDPLATKVFLNPPAAADRRKTIQKLPVQLVAGNLGLASQFAEDCASRPAFAYMAMPRIRLCPAFIGLGEVPQARSLLAEALHLEGIGTMTDKDCPKAGCGDACGDKGNAKTWVRYLECSTSI